MASVDQGSICLTDGRQLPAEYRQFTHGYAVTAHVSQGKTVDWVVNAPDGMTKDLFYVAETRGREGSTTVTSDKVALEEAIGVSGDRQSAMELERRAAAIARAPAVREIEADDYRLYQARQQQQARAVQRPAHSNAARGDQTACRHTPRNRP